MKELVFDTGLVEFNVNGVCTISFNPTDSGFVERLVGAFDVLEQKQSEYEKEARVAAEKENKKEIFEVARRRDTEMREIIDNVFERPVSAELFGHKNVYAMASGLPVWCNFMLAVVDEIDAAISNEQKATGERLKKYTEKYQRK